MASPAWVEIKTAESVTPFREHFVAFKSELAFHRFVEVMTIKSNEGNLKIGYVGHSMRTWATYPQQTGYSMDLLVPKDRKSAVYAQATLVNTALRTANVSFRFLTLAELEEIYSILFLKETGTVNSCVGGFYLISIKNQLREMNLDVKLPFFKEYVHRLLDRSSWSKYV